MSSFIATQPTLDAYWRAIILFGRNSAAYKFALATSLLQLAERGTTSARLDEVAVPFADAVTTHVKLAKRQGTAASSKYLEACRQFINGTIKREQLIDQTVKFGFVNVLDAYHVVSGRETEKRFFVVDAGPPKSIRLTDELLTLVGDVQSRNLPSETEARWRLVETAWELEVSAALLNIGFAHESRRLFVDAARRRIDITSARDALNGYQKGRCFFCFNTISVRSGDADLSDVDHFFPFALTRILGPEANLNGVWNLVLACRSCNRGGAGKFDRIPEVRLLERLHRRNSYLIESHHPLRETLMKQIGANEPERRRFLSDMDKSAISHLLHRWTSANELEPAF